MKIKQIKKRLDAGQFEEALALITENKNEATDKELYDIAEIYQQLGFPNEALAIIEKLMNDYPEDTSLVLAYSEILMDIDREEEAIQILYQIGEDDENYVAALLLLADLYEMQGLTEVSEQKLLEAFAKQPSNHLLSFALGEFYYAEKDAKKAIYYYEQALEKETVILETSIHVQLGKALSECGKYEEALEHFEQGIKDKVDLDSLFSAGMTAFYAQKYEVAIRYLEELKQLDHEYTTLYYFLAKSYQEIGALQEAEENIEKGLYFDKHNPYLYYLAAELAYKKGNMEEEKEYLLQVLQIEEHHYDAFLRLLEMFFETGEYERIIEWASRVDDTKEFPMYQWYLARAYRELERYEEAAESFEKVKATFDKDETFLEEYASFLMEEGRREEALGCLKKIITINPARTDIFDQMDRLEFDDF